MNESTLRMTRPVFPILSSERINGQRAKTLEKNYARARSTPPKLKKRAPKVGGFAAHFACGFLEFWKGGTRSRIVFLKVFVRRPVIISDDNIRMVVILWTDKSLHDLVENYAEITPKLRGKTRHPRRPKLAAALPRPVLGCGGVAFFPRSFGVIVNQIAQRFDHPQNYHAEKKARRASRAAPFLWALDLPILPLYAVAQAKSWTFLVESWTFDRPE